MLSKDDGGVEYGVSGKKAKESEGVEIERGLFAGKDDAVRSGAEDDEEGEEGDGDFKIEVGLDFGDFKGGGFVAMKLVVERFKRVIFKRNEDAPFHAGMPFEVGEGLSVERFDFF